MQGAAAAGFCITVVPNDKNIRFFTSAADCRRHPTFQARPRATSLALPSPPGRRLGRRPPGAPPAAAGTPSDGLPPSGGKSPRAAPHRACRPPAPQRAYTAKAGGAAPVCTRNRTRLASGGALSEPCTLRHQRLSRDVFVWRARRARSRTDSRRSASSPPTLAPTERSASGGAEHRTTGAPEASGRALATAPWTSRLTRESSFAGRFARRSALDAATTTARPRRQASLRPVASPRVSPAPPRQPAEPPGGGGAGAPARSSTGPPAGADTSTTTTPTSAPPPRARVRTLLARRPALAPRPLRDEPAVSTTVTSTVGPGDPAASGALHSRSSSPPCAVAAVAGRRKLKSASTLSRVVWVSR